MAEETYLECFRSEDLLLEFEEPNQLTIAGWTVEALLTRQGDETVLATFESGNGIEEADDFIGWEMPLLSDNTDRDPGVYWINLWRTDLDERALLGEYRLTIRSARAFPS